MELKAITYHRVKNLGNYETERFEASANLTNDDDPNKAFEALKAYVEHHLGITASSSSFPDEEF